MKPLLPLLFSTLMTGLVAVESAPTPKLESRVYRWADLPVTPTPVGERRAVLDGATTSVDKLHVHITRLNPGEKSGEPRRHLQEEVIIVREGTLEVTCDGQVSVAGAGDVIFFAARATTVLRNFGATPATYTVVYYFTPLTPKE
jgi:XRE family transcriptional regulator, regulator of sulfur utilization